MRGMTSCKLADMKPQDRAHAPDALLDPTPDPARRHARSSTLPAGALLASTVGPSESLQYLLSRPIDAVTCMLLAVALKLES